MSTLTETTTTHRPVRNRPNVYLRRRHLRFAIVGCGVLVSIVLSSNLSFAGDTKDTAHANPKSTALIAADSFDYKTGQLRYGDLGTGWGRDWKVSRSAVPKIVAGSANTTAKPEQLQERMLEFNGTGSRNNPLRRALTKPLSQREVFIRFDLRYLSDPSAANTVDPEFMVLWMDRIDGGDGATHAGNVPNIGLHTADRGPQKGRNVFMIRIGAAKTSFSTVEVQKDRTYRVVARLSKSSEGDRAVYDRLDMWIDPVFDQYSSPAATVAGAKSFSTVNWIGFSTGLKTEVNDRIQIDNLVLTKSWASVLDDSLTNPLESKVRGHNGVVWDQPVDFARDVYPVLKSHCFDCHAGDKPDSGYRLDVHRELSGYSTGEVLAETGYSRHSRLIDVVSSTSDEHRMPPEGNERLTDQQIAMLQAWIDQE